MSNSGKEKIHWSFLVIVGLGLLWNIMGSLNFFVQMNADNVASMPEAYQAVIGARPIWATIAFAIAVFGGALGCLLLLIRKSAAIYLFIASLLGVIITMIHALSINSPDIDFMPVMVGTSMSLIVAAFFVWYFKFTKGKNWIE